jgi:hypothetical protein
MVPSVPPTVHPHGWETIFRQAFTPARQAEFNLLADTESAPNEACGDPLVPSFDGLYAWSNNVNTLSLHNDLADLHKLCCQFKANNIGIAALQEINIDLSQSAIYQKVKAVFDENFQKQCTLICSTTHIQSSTNWKPCSTLLVIMPTWSPYIPKSCFRGPNSANQKFCITNSHYLNVGYGESADGKIVAHHGVWFSRNSFAQGEPDEIAVKTTISFSTEVWQQKRQGEAHRRPSQKQMELNELPYLKTKGSLRSWQNNGPQQR